MPIDDYLSLVINSPIWIKGNIAGLMTIFLLGLARMLPIMVLAPFFGSKILPNTAKVLFAFAIFFVIFPSILVKVQEPMPFDSMLILYLGKEVLIGFLLGLLAAIPFFAATMAGSLIDRQRGSSSLMALDPTMKIQASSLGILYNRILIVVFFLVYGPMHFIEAIMLSYDLVPPNELLNTSFFLIPYESSIFWSAMVRLGSTLLLLSIQLGAPSIIAVLMTDMFLGIINRLAPQVQIFFLGLPLKSLLAIWLLFNSWWFIIKFMEDETLEWILQIKRLVMSFVV